MPIALGTGLSPVFGGSSGGGRFKWFLASGVVATGYWEDIALWTSTDIYNARQLWAGGQWNDAKAW